MTPTISAERYGGLLSKYQPRVIKTEVESEAFLKAVEELMARSHLTSEEELLLELLVKLIEDFEAQHYRLNLSTPQTRLLHLMEQRALKTDDLNELLGERAAAIVSGQEKIESEDAIALGQFFQVKPELFLVRSAFT